MKNENIVVTSGDYEQRRSLMYTVGELGREGGHHYVGMIRSPQDVDTLIRIDAKPTVAIFGTKMEGELAKKVAERMRDEFGGIVIIGFHEDENQKPAWADHSLQFETSDKDLMKFITNLKH